MTDFLRKLITDAVAAGFTLDVNHEGETDYLGTNPDEAYKAATACDCMWINLIAADGKVTGYALVINGLNDDEVIADYSGQWLDEWWNRNIGSNL